MEWWESDEGAPAILFIFIKHDIRQDHQINESGVKNLGKKKSEITTLGKGKTNILRKLSYGEVTMNLKRS